MRGEPTALQYLHHFLHRSQLLRKIPGPTEVAVRNLRNVDVAMRIHSNTVRILEYPLAPAIKHVAGCIENEDRGGAAIKDINALPLTDGDRGCLAVVPAI